MYAQRRTYGPPALRSNANRSNHSLLSQASPTRRSISPLAHPDDGTPSSDWLRRYGPVSMSSSPARSTLSLASTTNPYQVAPAASTTTIPGKPSPLYYDYTEDFDIDDYNRPAVLDPPPQFRIDKTIPEDRPLSADWRKDSNPDYYGAKLRSSSENSTVIHHKVVDHSHSSGPPSPRSNIAIDSKHQQNGRQEVNNSNESKSTRDTKVIRLSGLDIGAQELNRSVVEAFGLVSAPSFELVFAGVDGNTQCGAFGAFGDESRLSLPNTEIVESASLRTSGYSFNTHLRQFPPPPADSNLVSDERSEGPSSRLSSDTFGGRGRDSHNSQRIISLSSPTRIYAAGTADHGVQHQVLTTNNRKRSSQFLASDSNVVEDSDPSTKCRSFEIPGPIGKGQQLGSIHLLDSTIAPNISAVPGQFVTPTWYGETPASQPSDQASKESEKMQPHTPSNLSHRPSKKRRVEAVTEPTYRDADVPNFSHQIPRRLATRSDSPMLAPKAISPARQLKLKNSIPQLMKALPTVPGHPEKLTRSVSPLVHPESAQASTSQCNFSPLVHEADTSASGALQQTTGRDVLSGALSNPSSGIAELDSRPLIYVTTMVEDEPEPSSQPAKLKLKMRSSASLRPISADSRPWNCEDSYPWSESKAEAEAPIQPVHDGVSPSIRQPKFKLRVIRASNSTMDTVRVNRESSESRSRGGIQLRNPKDLFTPNSGKDNMFSSIRQHLHSRKASNASNGPSIDSKVVTVPGHCSGQPKEEPLNQLADSERVPSSSGAHNPTQAASWFSEDSIHSHERPNLRKRISNLRSRMLTPYASRNAAQSYDDLTWRTQNQEHSPSPSLTRSNPDLHTVSISVEPERKKGIPGRIRVHNLRTRVSEWLKGAKLAFTAHVKRGTQH